MSAVTTKPESRSWPQGPDIVNEPAYTGPPRNLAYLESLRLDPALQPTTYHINGTPSDSKILFTDVNILDSTGREPYQGHVLIEGDRFTAVGAVTNVEQYMNDATVRVFTGRGRTLMSGLGDGHAHLTWNGGDLERLQELPIEEHVLSTTQSAQCFLDSGYTMAFGAASAKDRLDVVIRNAINSGDIPGPRYLANAKEIAKPDGDLVEGITAFASGPEGLRRVVRHHIEGIGADNVKLSMSGEDIIEIRLARECFFHHDETAAAVDEAHKLKKRVCAHARSRDSVTMCARNSVDVIYHASYTDDEGMRLLEQTKDRTFVVPAINWLWATLNEAEAFGYTQQKAEKDGYGRELWVAVACLREMHKRGIIVLPGGDYGFAWTPHGTYARDLEHFVKLLGFTPHESIIAATAGIAALFMRSHELGRILPEYYADCILVDGNPLDDISILQDHDKLNVILINGRVHKAGRGEYK